MKFNKITGTTNLTHEQWLDKRRMGIGGSDVAGVLGISQYSTPYTVWADKLGLLPDVQPNEAMRLGTDLEHYVAQRFTETTGYQVRRLNSMLKNDAYPYSQANIDRYLVGRDIGLECKTCSPFRKPEFMDGKYPYEYHAQCLHYMAVTGWNTWYLAVLIFGDSFNVYKIERKDVQQDIDTMQYMIKEFWENYVLTKTPPPKDGLRATTEAINTIYDTAVDSSIDLGHLEEHFIEIHALDNEIRQLETKREAHKQEIKSCMGENMRGECSAWVANWKPNKNGVRRFFIKEKECG